MAAPMIAFLPFPPLLGHPVGQWSPSGQWSVVSGQWSVVSGHPVGQLTDTALQPLLCTT